MTSTSGITRDEKSESSRHVSVLLNESINGLNLKGGDIFVDCTLGNAGHTAEVIRRFGKTVKIIAIDSDSQAIERSKEVLAGAEYDVTFINDNFRNIGTILEKLKIKAVGEILLDLGLSSEELGQSGRGFSFLKDEPLLMTFSDKLAEGQLTAMDIVNTWDESELEKILREYGEEKFSRQIAHAIVYERKTKLLTTTFMLVNAIEKALSPKFRRGRIHFATKTFQAIRIATNDELGALKQVLKSGFEVLKSEGRMAVISFHSLEDREVKNYFKYLTNNENGITLTKKPLTPSRKEINTNRRARSAKLRIIIKN